MRGAIYICAAGAALALAAPAGAATITVNEGDDDASGAGCELREAVTAANTNVMAGGCAGGTAGTDTIEFSLTTPATINLQGSALPAVPAGEVLVIGGPTADPSDVVINQTADNHRILDTAANLTVTNVALKNGGLFGNGGAINSTATVNVTDTLFEDNTGNTFSGGCIYATTIVATDSTFDNNQASTGGCLAADTMTVTDSTFTSNDAFAGGALAPRVALTVTGSTFGGPSAAEGNVATNAGGAITSAGSLDTVGYNIDNSTFTNNRSTSGTGGAIHHESPGDVVVDDSTFSSNQADIDGGAVAHFGGNITLTGSTFFLNSADGGGGAIKIGTDTGLDEVKNSTFRLNSAGANGGSINSQDVVSLLHDTFVDNASPTGDIVHADPGDEVTLASSIVADTSSTSGTNCSGSIVDGGYNVSFGDETGSSCPAGGTNVTGNPNIGPLGPFGGSTSTVFLNSPSAAVDLIPNLDCSESADQRGASRPVPVGGRCDAGSVEVEFLADGKVSMSGQPAIGDDIYNEDADGQAKTLKVKPGKRASFDIGIQNDAQLLVDAFTVTGPGSNSKYSVKYLDGADDITAEVTGAGFETSSLGPGSEQTLTLVVKPKKTTTKGKRRVPVSIASLEYEDRSDTVEAVTQVK